MSWPVLILTAYVLLGLELGVREPLKLGPLSAAPSFLVPLVVFVALYAPAYTALFVAGALGLVVDLLTARGASAVVLPGPNALGFMAAAYFTLLARPIIMRRNAFTLIVLSMLATAVSGLVVVALFAVRGWYADDTVVRPLSELGERMLTALYTGASAALLSVVLLPMVPVFRFHDPHTRRPITRRF